MRRKARFEGQASRLADLSETSAGHCNSVRGVGEEGKKQTAVDRGLKAGKDEIERRGG